MHRDIKPANILIDDEQRPVIVDFGLARNEEADATLTRADQRLGSPSYMSPEQTHSEVSQHWRPYGRLFARGYVVRGSCVAEAVRGTDDGLLYEEIRTAPFPDPRRHVPELGADLVTVLETSMERDLLRRYRTALDFADDLLRVREARRVRARPPGPLLRLRRWSQRHPGMAISVPLAAVLLAACIAIWLGRSRPNATPIYV